MMKGNFCLFSFLYSSFNGVVPFISRSSVQPQEEHSSVQGIPRRVARNPQEHPSPASRPLSLFFLLLHHRRSPLQPRRLLHNHFQSYYSALDLAALDDVSQVLYPDWRNPLETPFLFLGDFHPKIFTSLLRSFLELDDDASESSKFDSIVERFIFLDNRDVWRNPSATLTGRIEQIECGLRLMVPSLVARARDAQTGLVDKVAAGWWTTVRERRRWLDDEGELGKKVIEAVDELSCVVVDANRLRRSVVGEILGVVDVYQAALFLQALAQFVVGFRDVDLLSEFKRCRISLR